MADRLQLTNDTAQGGVYFDEDTFDFAIANATETSAHGASASNVPIAGPMKANGRIIGFTIGVVANALSASGFVSGSVSAQVNVNSANAVSTNPAITVGATSAAIGRKFSDKVGDANCQAAVLNPLSANFSTGDQISISYQLQSGGSAAAGAAGTGFYARVTVRYAAV